MTQASPRSGEETSRAGEEPARERAVSLPRAKSDVVLGVLILLLVLIAYRALSGWNPGRPLGDEAPALFVASDTSPVFIGSLSALFLYMRIYRLRAALRSPAPSAWGWLLVIPACVVFTWAHHTGARDILLLSFIPMVLGGGLVSVGPRFSRALLLPTLFLLFAYPVPAVLANQQVYAFQVATVEFVTWFIGSLGISVLAEGDLVYVHKRVFEVIETCSGLRLTETLVTSAFAYAEVMRTRRSHQIIIILCAPLLGFLLNAVRVLMIMFNPVADYASDHTLQGIIVVVAGVLSFALIESILKRVAPGQTAPAATPAKARDGRKSARPALARIAIPLAACALISVFLPTWTPVHPITWQVVMPVKWDGWKATKADKDKEFLGSVYYSRYMLRHYTKDGALVEVLAARDDRLKRDRSIFSPKNEVPGAGWQVLERRLVPVGWTDSDVSEIVATRRGQEILIYQWYEGTPGLGTETRRAFLGLENSALRLAEEARVFRVSTNLPRGSEQRQAANERVDKFAREIRRSLDG